MIDELKKVFEILRTIDYGKVTIEVQAGKVFRIVKEESIKI